MDELERIRKLYAAFNARDLEVALAGMQPDVDWANGMEGGRVHGRDGVRAYWTRQWTMIDPRVDPLALERETDGRIAVTVHTTVHDREGALLHDGKVVHVYRMRDGLVAHMEIRDA
jgi:hypothetical protein